MVVLTLMAADVWALSEVRYSTVCSLFIGSQRSDRLAAAMLSWYNISTMKKKGAHRSLTRHRQVKFHNVVARCTVAFHVLYCPHARQQ